MDDFDRLLALTRAAESCNGLARSFIDHYGEPPEFSRFLSAEGQPYCQPAADQQAAQHMDGAHRDAGRLREETRTWDRASDAHYFVQKAAADQRLPVIEFNGSTYPTAHEAARYFAEAVSEVLGRVEGYGDIEHSFELARLLADFRPVPDYYGQIQRESIAAEEFTPVESDQQGEDGLVTITEIAKIAGVNNPRTVRNLAIRHPLPSAAVTGAGTRGHQYRYAEVRAWAVAHWPARSSEFPATFAEAQKKLAPASDT